MELYIVIGLLALVVLLQVILLFKKNKVDISRELKGQTELFSQVMGQMRTDVSGEFGQNRKELADSLSSIHKTLGEQHAEILKSENEQQTKLYYTLNNQSEKIRATLSESVEKLQQSNEKKLEEMRATVDEKLTATLTTRLDSSFKTVGEQLQNVYKSLGEMKELSGGVNDLQRILSNVKVRGTWAEVQLGNLLEQILTEDQFLRNVSIRNNQERVEFAVKIPSRDEDNTFVLLPIDSKFPQEDYLRLQAAAETANKEAVEQCSKALENIIKSEAKKISDLYIDVPHTTDFAIMFLPTEGLYAEALRRPGLVEELQHKFRIMVCGPTTITAFLNTLKMGFRTIALDKRAAEVWKILGAAKTQYESFGVVLEKAKKKIDEAGNVLEDAQKRNSIIQKKLKDVEKLEPAEASNLLETAIFEE